MVVHLHIKLQELPTVKLRGMSEGTGCQVEEGEESFAGFKVFETVALLE
jgi:hypothetical protein